MDALTDTFRYACILKMRIIFLYILIVMENFSNCLSRP